MSNNDPKGVERRNFLQVIAAATLAPGNVHSEPADDTSAQGSGSAGEDATTAAIMVEKLIDWDVSHVFGMVGDGINPIIDALRRRQDRIRFIGVRHEEAAAFMACGWAKHTGRLGVCLATTAPEQYIC